MRFLAFLLALMVPAAAHATVDMYRNPQFGYSFSFPDSWWAQPENGELPHTFTIKSNEGRGNGHCSITSDEDRRFMIYPAKAQADLMQRVLGPEFWTGWLADNDNVTFIDTYERGGLGDGAATSVLVDYITPRGVPERARMAATVHGGVRYVFACASTQQDFAKYEETFNSIIATLKMKPAYNPFPQGFYRDFTKDRGLFFPVGEGVGTVGF